MTLTYDIAIYDRLIKSERHVAWMFLQEVWQLIQTNPGVNCEDDKVIRYDHDKTS